VVVLPRAGCREARRLVREGLPVAPWPWGCRRPARGACFDAEAAAGLHRGGEPASSTCGWAGAWRAGRAPRSPSCTSARKATAKRSTSRSPATWSRAGPPRSVGCAAVSASEPVRWSSRSCPGGQGRLRSDRDRRSGRTLPHHRSGGDESAPLEDRTAGPDRPRANVELIPPSPRIQHPSGASAFSALSVPARAASPIPTGKGARE
jgi:hypothetical protein